MKHKKLLLNCDLGEGANNDGAIMPYIDQANIACGGHTGDSESMLATVKLAAEHQVAIGAHPSYPDREHFGRQRVDISEQELAKSLHKQVSDLQAICAQQGAALQHIKAHGALYNDSFKNEARCMLLMELAQHFNCDLLLQATDDSTSLIALSQRMRIHILWEGFADRAYTNTGALVPRSYEHASHKTIDTIVKQAVCFQQQYGVYTEKQDWLTLPIDTLCVHGDTPHALDAVTHIHHALNRHS